MQPRPPARHGSARIIHPDARPLGGGWLRWTAYVVGVVLVFASMVVAPWAVVPLVAALVVLCITWPNGGHDGHAVE